MGILIKTPSEIEKMRFAGKLAAEVLEMIEDVFVGEVDRGGHLRERTIKNRKGWVEIEHEWTIL